MSLSRFAAFGLALLAGVTLESCASSGAFFPSTGPNPAVPSVNGTRVQFVQGSPNLNLGISFVDVYIDNRLVFPSLPYGAITPFIVLPPGPHDFKLVQAGTLFPVFLDQVITFASGGKNAVVAEGDAAYHTTNFAVWKLPIYATPIGIRAVSVLHASPNARANIDFWYNCPTAGQCGDGVTATEGTSIGLGITLGNPAAPSSSWRNAFLLKASGTASYCFGAYTSGGAILPAVNAATGPPNATVPSFSAADDPKNALCTTTSGSDSLFIGGGSNVNFFVVDTFSVAPRVPAHGPSMVFFEFDQNG